MTTPSLETEIAVLKTQSKTVSDTMTRIELKLDAINSSFVMRNEFNEFKRRWALSHTLVSMISVIFATLVTLYFTALKK